MDMFKAVKLVVTLLFLSSSAIGQTISTVAGGGPLNLPALQTGLPCGSLAVDSAGNLYCATPTLNQIWKIDTAGNVNLFAGTGFQGYGGDGGQAVNASFSSPGSIAFNPAGELIVSDFGNSSIRKISISGVISTIAGQGNGGFSGDGGPAILARLYLPTSLWVDSSGNIFFVDSMNQVIRMISGGTIRTVVGRYNSNGGGIFEGGSALAVTLPNPRGIATDSSGNLYFYDATYKKVYRVTNGSVYTYAGTGQSGTGTGIATSVGINNPNSLAVDRFDNLYLNEGTGIRVIAPNQPNIAAFAGTYTAGYSGDGGSPLSATLTGAGFIAFNSSGSVTYISDVGRIRKISANTISTYAGNGTVDYESGAAPPALSLYSPYNLAIEPFSSNLAFLDRGSSGIRKLSQLTNTIFNQLGNGFFGFSPDGSTTSSPLAAPGVFAISPTGDYYFVESNRIRKTAGSSLTTVANLQNTSGASTGDGGPALNAGFCFPKALAADSNGDLYIIDCSVVRKIAKQTGLISTLPLPALAGPSALTLDGVGDLYITETDGKQVRRVDLATNATYIAAGNGTTNYSDGMPAPLTGLVFPTSTLIDHSGNLFINTNFRIVMVSGSTGLTSTVLGTGNPPTSFAPDGTPALAAAVNPLSFTISPQSLYFTDANRIRSVKVPACFFTVDTPTVYINKYGGGYRPITVTASDPSCRFTLNKIASPPDPFTISFNEGPYFGTTALAFTLSGNPFGTRKITYQINNGPSFTIQEGGAKTPQNIGFFQPTNGPLWALDTNGNGSFDVGDQFFSFTSQPGAIAVAGDWNGDGRSKVGFYLNGFWALDYNGNGVWDGPAGGDRFYAFGCATCTPVVGDWNLDGRTKIGYYNAGFWALDTNGNGAFDSSDSYFAWGGNGAGEVPLVGDWNGDGRTKIGYFYQGKWVLDTNGNGQFDVGIDRYSTTFPYAPGDKPVTGDWTGDGIAKIGIYRNGFWILDANNNGTYDGAVDKFYAFGGRPGDTPIVGDWSGDKRDKIGVYNAGFWMLDVNGNGAFDGLGPGQDRFNGFGGTPGNQPLIGRW